jgi:hypothetical protein
MPSRSAVIVDTLLSLFDAERASIFRLMGPDSPYLAGAPPRVRAVLAAMKQENERHVAALADAIRSVDGPPPSAELAREAYLDHLPLKFLLPKLANENQLLIERYANALRAMPKDAPREIVDLLRRQNAEYKADVQALDAAGEEVLARPG